MAQIEWSLLAKEDLQEIYDYISNDSERYALRMVDRLVERTEILSTQIEVGRVVPEFEDENLNNWAKNAREQAESFAKMAFDEFAKLVIGVVKETGFQISNVIIGVIGGLLLIAGINDTCVYIATNFSKGNPAEIILAIVGFIIVRFAYQREQKHKQK